MDNFINKFLFFFTSRPKKIFRETEQYAKREEFWREIEELARRKNPREFDSMLNDMEYLSLSNSQNNNDYTNEDDFGEIDHYSKDVSRMGN